MDKKFGQGRPPPSIGQNQKEQLLFSGDLPLYINKQGRVQQPYPFCEKADSQNNPQEWWRDWYFMLLILIANLFSWLCKVDETNWSLVYSPLGHLKSFYKKQLIVIALDNNISYCMHFKSCSFIRSQRFQGLKCSWFIFENCIFKNQLRQPRTQFLVVLKEYELCENLNCWENQDQTTTETRKPKNKGTPVPPFPNASITTKW